MDTGQSASYAHRNLNGSDISSEKIPWPESHSSHSPCPATNGQYASRAARVLGNSLMLPEVHTVNDLTPGIERITLSELESHFDSGFQYHGMSSSTPRVQKCSLSTPTSEKTAHYTTPSTKIPAGRTRGVPCTPTESSLKPDEHRDRQGRSSRLKSMSPGHKRQYIIADEERPPDGYHQSAVAQAIAESKILLSTVNQTLESSTLHERECSQLRALYLRSRDLISFENAACTRIALVGESGAGKSRLINSLLDLECLARADSSGGACTCVATEYHYHESNEFVISVDYFTEKECHKQFTQLLQSLRNPVKDGEEIEDDNSAQRDIARETFAAVFPGHFPRHQASLLQASWKEASKTLLDWVHESGVKLKQDASDKPTMMSFPNAQDCAAELMALTSVTKNKTQRCLWPYIRTLRVYLRATVLSEGLVLVDLPGLRDSSAVRREITERSLRLCDEVFAVCPVSRASTNADVDYIFTLARKAALSRVGIICTKSDDFRPEEYGEGAGEHVKKTIKAFQDKMNAADEDINQANAVLHELAEDDSDVDDQEHMLHEEALKICEAGQKKRRAEKLRDQLDYQMRHFVCSHRNDNVTRQLQRAYGTRNDSRSTPIFCVSNEYYWQNRHKDGLHTCDFIRLSIIPEVRRFCLSIVPENQLHAGRNYLQNEIPLLLQDLLLWIQTGSALSSTGETRNAILSILDEVEEGLTKLILPTSVTENNLHGLERDFIDKVSRPMRKKTKAFTESAHNATHSWRTIHASTYGAFCRKDGVHCNWNGSVDRDWNEEATADLVYIMGGPWGDYREQIPTTIAAVQDSIACAVENAISRASISGDLAEALPTLAHSVRRRKDTIQYALDQLESDFQSKLQALTVDVFEVIPTSYFRQLMAPIYQRAAAKQGKGSWEKRKQIIESAFQDDDIMSTIHRRFDRRFLELLRDLHDNIQSIIEGNIHSSFDTIRSLRSENAVAESEEDAAFRERVIDVLTSSTAELIRLASQVAA